MRERHKAPVPQGGRIRRRPRDRARRPERRTARLRRRRRSAQAAERSGESALIWINRSPFVVCSTRLFSSERHLRRRRRRHTHTLTVHKKHKKAVSASTGSRLAAEIPDGRLAPERTRSVHLPVGPQKQFHPTSRASSPCFGWAAKAGEHLNWLICGPTNSSAAAAASSRQLSAGLGSACF
jgi:hypothetical protein